MPPVKQAVKKPSTVYQLGAISFLADIASEMLYPIVPIFLTTTLGASMTSVGLIEGVAEGVSALLKSYAGYWSDRLQRRKVFIFVGYLLSALSKSALGAAASWPAALAARSLDRVGKGLRTAPRDAMLGESVSSKCRGLAFGIHRGMDTAGATLGPLLALVYLHYYTDLRMIFLWALIPGLLAAALVLVIPESTPKALAEKPSLSWRELSPGLRRYILVWGFFTATNSSDAFLLLRAKEVGMSLTETILAYCFYNLVYASLSPWYGKRADREGKKPVLIRSLGFFAVVYVGFAFVENRAQVWFFFAIYGLFMAASEGVGKAYALDMAPPESKASVLGIFGMMTGFATIFASTIGGLLWDRFGSRPTFLLGVVGAVMAMLLLSVVPPKTAAAIPSAG